MALLTLLAAATIATARQRNLFGVVVLFSIYSFLMATLLVALDAVDVGMTEAAVGAGVSTVLLLTTLQLVRTTEMRPVHPRWLPMLVALVVGAAVVWGTLSLPSFGVADSVVHQHVAPYYLSQSIPQTGVPNVVTAVLADYRGFDTLGETTVIFAAGMGVLLLLRGMRRRHDVDRRNQS